MKIKHIFYLAYLLLLTVISLIDIMQCLNLNIYVNAAIAILLFVMAVTRIPFISHSLTLPKSTEALAIEQEKHPFMSFPLFLPLLLPLIIASLFMTLF